MSDDAAEYPSVRYDSRGPRGWWVVGGFVVVLLIGLAIAARIAVAQLPPGTTLAGVDVRTPDQAAEVADQIAGRLIELPVELTTAAGTTTVRAGRLGATLETAGVRAAAVEATGLDGWVDRFTGGGTVQLPIEVATDRIDLEEVVQQVSRPPVDGDLAITPAGVEVTEPVVGVSVTAQQVRDSVTPRLAELARTPAEDWPAPLVIELDGATTDPVVTQASVDAALERLERLTAEPVELVAEVTPEDAQTVDSEGVPTREEARLTLTARDLRSLLTTEVDPDVVQANRLVLTPDPSDPPADLREFLEQAAVVPDLAITVEDRSPPPARGAGEPGPGGPADRAAYADVSTVTGRLATEVLAPGLEPDLERTIQAVIDAADGEDRTAQVQGMPVDRDDPALLGIVEPVSTYTTFFTPGEGRNTNIRRIAEIVDGTLIPPGANYEVNHAVGRRTTERGFVSAGAILEGEFVSDVGGGVSQFATTFFNAMWFGGHDIITHTPHSYWFERYPAGREATIDYPGVDLEVNNDSPYWILVDTFVTDDSVTVTFWSTPYFQVEQSIGPREPVPDQDFRVTITRTVTAPPLPELDLDGFTYSDTFAKTYGNPP